MISWFEMWQRFRRRCTPITAFRCRKVLRELQAYLDGVLEEPSATRVARHLESCRRCGREAEVYGQIKKSLARRDPGLGEDAEKRLRMFAAQLPDDKREK